MNRAQIIQKIKDEQTQMSSRQFQQEALLKLYGSATLLNDTASMDRYRQELHDLMDLMLDGLSTMHMLSRAYADATI